MNKGAVPTTSPVVEVMRQAAIESWRKWMRHVVAGTADTAAGLEAFDHARLAGRVWLDEVAARAERAPTAKAAA